MDYSTTKKRDYAWMSQASYLASVASVALLTLANSKRRADKQA